MPPGRIVASVGSTDPTEPSLELSDRRSEVSDPQAGAGAAARPPDAAAAAPPPPPAPAHSDPAPLPAALARHAGGADEQYTYDDLFAPPDAAGGAAGGGAGSPRRGAGDQETQGSTEIDLARLNVGQRLYYIGCGMERNRQERLRRERESREMSEIGTLTAKPMITPRGRRHPGKGESFAELSELWARRNERMKRQQAARQAQEEAAETLKKVEMNGHSKKLVARLEGKDDGSGYQGPITGWNKHFARYQTKKNTTPPTELFTPCINAPLTKAGDEDNDPVGHRLYARKDERKEKMEELKDRSLQEHIQQCPFRPDLSAAKRRAAAARSEGPRCSGSARPGSPRRGQHEGFAQKAQEWKNKLEKYRTEMQDRQWETQCRVQKRRKQEQEKQAQVQGTVPGRAEGSDVPWFKPDINTDKPEHRLAGAESRKERLERLFSPDYMKKRQTSQVTPQSPPATRVRKDTLSHGTVWGKPGKYITMHENYWVTETVDLGPSIATLPAHNRVDVVEIVRREDVKLLRARIADPPGWITLENFQNAPPIRQLRPAGPERSDPHPQSRTFKGFDKRNMRNLEKRREKIAEYQRKLESEMDQQCTFTPRLNRKSDHIFHGAPVRGGAPMNNAPYAQDQRRGSFDGAAGRRRGGAGGGADGDDGADHGPMGPVTGVAGGGDAAPRKGGGAAFGDAPRARRADDEAGDVDVAMKEFECEMDQVLREWQKLEDV